MTAVRGGALPGRELAGLLFTNSSFATCTVRGYPSAQLRYRGSALGQPAARSPGRIRLVTLRPGASAQAQLTAVTTCQSPISDHARVRPPGTTRSTDVAIELRGCSLSTGSVQPA